MNIWKRLKEIMFGDDGWRECPTCEGRGFWLYKYSVLDSPFVQIEGEKRNGTKCKTCDGTGTYYIPTHQEMG